MRRCLALIALALEVGYCPIGKAQNPPAPLGNTKPNDAEEGISDLIPDCFSRWDANHDGVLTIQELDGAITDPKVNGKEAALAVILRRDAQPKDEDPRSWTQPEIVTHFNDPATRRRVKQMSHHVSTMKDPASRALFVTGEPNLDSFQQGRVGDCFLLSRIAVLVHHNPQQVRKMITASGDEYEVHFASGANVSVPCLTDGELLIGVHNGPEHGVWLSVLEKSYTLMVAKVAAKRGADSSKLPKVVLEQQHRGESDLFLPVGDLLTGRKEKRVSLKTGVAMSAPVPRNNNKKTILKRINDLLLETLEQGRMITLATGKDPLKKLPKHVPGSHAYAVLEYDPGRRTVTVFNPWGKTVTPDGPSGLINGYPTQNGTFEVPLEELVQIFAYLSIETNERSSDPFLD